MKLGLCLQRQFAKSSGLTDGLTGWTFLLPDKQNNNR